MMMKGKDGSKNGQKIELNMKRKFKILMMITSYSNIFEII